MLTWKLTIEYDGSRYSGWQEQKNARTVAGEIKQAAEELFSGEIDLQGAGRTDAGVHARGQVAHLRATPKRRPRPEEVMQALNDKLPADIAVLSLDNAPPRFHARHDAVSRTYVYQISRRKTAFAKKFVWWVKTDLDTRAMQAAASLVAGRHDFACFRAEDASRPGESTIVSVDSCSIEQRPEEGLIVFRIEASHFLWRMVRRLVGATVKAGLGELPLDGFERLLGGKPDKRFDIAAWTAPASGLFLESVRYRTRP